MEKLEYLRNLHNAAYIANLSDTDRAGDWQTPDLASGHVNAILEMIQSILTPVEYEAFLNHFGDFESFVHYMKKEAAPKEKTYTFIFRTVDANGKLSALYEVPFKGFDSEESAYSELQSMFTYDDKGFDYFKGEMIDSVIQTIES